MGHPMTGLLAGALAREGNETEVPPKAHVVPDEELRAVWAEGKMGR